MWRQCPLRQNDPIYLLLGLQLSDLFAGGTIMGVAVLLGNALVGFALAPIALYISRALRKNKPPGRFARELHWLGLWRIPGALPAQNHVYRVF